MGLPSRLLARVPAGIRTQSSDAMLVILGLPAGISSLLGTTESRALDSALPWLAVKGWALALIVGCVAWLVGITGVRLYGDVIVLTRLAPYRFGLHLLALAALVYGSAILLLTGWDGIAAAFYVLAFGCGTFLKALDLARIQRRAVDRG